MPCYVDIVVQKAVSRPLMIQDNIANGKAQPFVIRQLILVESLNPLIIWANSDTIIDLSAFYQSSVDILHKVTSTGKAAAPRYINKMTLLKKYLNTYSNSMSGNDGMKLWRKIVKQMMHAVVTLLKSSRDDVDHYPQSFGKFKPRYVKQVIDTYNITKSH